jgi:hypothetical protein
VSGLTNFFISQAKTLPALNQELIQPSGVIQTCSTIASTQSHPQSKAVDAANDATLQRILNAKGFESGVSIHLGKNIIIQEKLNFKSSSMI